MSSDLSCSTLKVTWSHRLPTRSTAPQRRRRGRQRVGGRGKSPVSPSSSSHLTRPCPISSSTVHCSDPQTKLWYIDQFSFLLLSRPPSSSTPFCPYLSSPLSLLLLLFPLPLFPLLFLPPSLSPLTPRPCVHQILTAPPSLPPPRLSSHAMSSLRNKSLSSKLTLPTRSSGKICWAPQEPWVLDRPLVLILWNY